MMRIRRWTEDLARHHHTRGNVHIYHESPKHSFWDLFINTKMQQEEFDRKAHAALDVLGVFLCIRP